MSVLIMGMKMPKDCLECEIKAWEEDFDGYVCPFSRIPCLSIGRQDDCPLVELLIDGDELVTAFSVCDSNTNVKIASVSATINHMPTVIEAEGE